MSFSMEMDTKSTVEFVPSKDSALNMDSEEFDAYVDAGADPLHLKYAEGKTYDDTTRFVMRKVLPYKATQKILDKQISTDVRGGETQVHISYILDEVRAAWIDVVNPLGIEDPIKYKKGSDGMASEEMVNFLWHAGVAMEMFRARTAAVGKQGDNPRKK